VNLDNVASIGDLRLICRRRIPRPVFDWLDGGAFEEETLKANTADFRTLRLRQRVMRDVGHRTLSTTALGQPMAMPVAISPTGMSGMVPGGDRGEILAARAARKAGIPFTLGMMALRSIEELRREVDGFWFQLCMLTDRGLMRAMVERAAAAGCPVLVLTMTWPVLSQMNRSVRAGHGRLPPRYTPANILAYGRRPLWALRTLAVQPIRFGNFEAHMPGRADIASIVAKLDATATWADVEWLRGLWPGKLLVKGVMDPEDARLAVAAGADGISVSNHGGNMLDATTSTVAALPGVVEAADGRVEVLLDGGIRSGQDVLKALALGARACLIGRAHLYGLGAAGEAGVAKALDIIRKELDVSAALTGLADVADASRDLLA
jgi:L-lactate dehydrogenase (cytochrome)